MLTDFSWMRKENIAVSYQSSHEFQPITNAHLGKTSGVIVCAKKKIILEFSFQNRPIVLARRYDEESLVRNREGFINHFNSLLPDKSKRKEEQIIDFFLMESQKVGNKRMKRFDLDVDTFRQICSDCQK